MTAHDELRNDVAEVVWANTNANIESARLIAAAIQTKLAKGAYRRVLVNRFGEVPVDLPRISLGSYVGIIAATLGLDATDVPT